MIRAIVRDAHPGDSTAVAELLAVAWASTYDGLLPRQVLAGRDRVDDREELTRLFSDQVPGGGLVCEFDDEIVGFVTFGPPNHDGAEGFLEVHAAYVAPDRIGGGIGSRLLLRLARHARRRGVVGLSWYVHVGNERMVHMSERIAAATGAPMERTWFGHPVTVLEYRYEL